MAALKFLIPGLLAVAAAYFLLFVLKRSAPRLHAWLTAKSDRIAWLGVSALFLAWVAVATYNNLDADSPGLAGPPVTPATDPPREAREVAEEAASGAVGSPSDDPDAQFFALSDSAKASTLMRLGTDFNGTGSLVSYLLDLENRIAAGDDSAVIPAVDLLMQCGLLDVPELVLNNNDGNPARLVAVECATLPERPGGYERTLLAEAALRGVPEAVLLEPGLPPLEVANSRDDAVRRDWAIGVSQRLELLAGKGNIEAFHELGRIYMANDYGMRDYALAAQNYRSFIDRTSASDPRRAGVAEFLRHICVRGNLPDGAGDPCGRQY
jgi:hypothetical protein